MFDEEEKKSSKQEALLSADPKSKSKSKSKCSTTPRLALQYGYNFIGGLLKSYSNARFITGALQLEKDENLQVSWYALGAALVFAVYLAWSESEAHNEKSKQINSSDEENNEKDLERGLTAEEITKAKQLTRQQGVVIAGHYASDVMEGTQVPMYMGQIFGMDELSYGYRMLCYSGIGLFSVLGNLQDLQDTEVSFRQGNLRRLRDVAKNSSVRSEESISEMVSPASRSDEPSLEAKSHTNLGKGSS